MSTKKSIQVAIKVRPLLKKEKDQQSLWRVVDNSIQLLDSQADPIYFDHIFDQDATNQVIFDKMAKPIVHSSIEGFNGTIFAYGQTSSGKTYTMMGDEENPGVMVLAAKEIFRQIQLATERQFLLRIGYIEIYNEKIYDLLNKKNQDLKIHETSNGIVSVNCEESIITSEEDFLQHLTQGTKERTVGETNMNERSSRSHAIFRIIIESRKIDRSEDDSVTQSVLNLVDLAGSERADQTGARGTRLKEGGHINKSLMFLSNVIKRLSEEEDHKYISYRDSKLTRILQASLGGNALTTIICTIKPTAVEETQSTLNFALRAKIIKTKPQVNETVSDATMMKRLEREIKTLKIRLEEEQRKNESQIKVRQLEQRIRNEDLKIISCNSLHTIRNREKRRRTWCPSSTNTDAISTGQLPSALPVPSAICLPSRLQPPKSSGYYTPLITFRPTEQPAAIQTSGGGLPLPEEVLPEIDEEFAPAELVNFDMLSPLKTPTLNRKPGYRVSITPRVTTDDKKLLEVVEHDLMELRDFTNLENKAGVQHDVDASLKQTIESLTNRNAVLEKERLKYLEVVNEINITSENLKEYEKRCDALQIQVTKLTTSNKLANDRVAKYEQELAEVKKTNEKLVMENREAVNLEFEFERHKNKSKQRENELLDALRDKEQEITRLDKSLKAICDEKLVNSKADLLQLSLTDTKVDDNGKVCVKCEDLQRLLEENRKITQEFEKLTLEYKQLQLNFQEIEKENESSKTKVLELEELQKAERAETEKLQNDLQVLKERLHDVQREYERVNTENSSKSEECMALNLQVVLASQEMVVLQDKYNELELSWQKQQQTLKDIEYQYTEIESKYKHLQTEYEQLEDCKGQSLTDCARLQKENVELQTEIEELKNKVKDVQHQLLENAEKTLEIDNNSAQKADDKHSNIQKEYEDLKQQLFELQAQFEDMQKDYDDMSNQFMDNLQESEALKEQNTKLEKKLKVFEQKCSEASKAESEMHDLKSQLEKLLSSERKSLLKTPSPCHNSSMRSSGVCIEDDEFDVCRESEELLQKFQELSECLTQIELEHQNGKRRVFKTPTTVPTPNYKLYLRNISGISKAQSDFVDEMENIHLQGTFKQHSFHVVELNQSTENGIEEENAQAQYDKDCENCLEVINKLKEQISSLNIANEQERQSKTSLLENTERNLSEMREQITQLTAELLEKSIFVENCACKTYQKQIESLEKEKADMTLVCEELQEKVSDGTFDGSLMNFTVNGGELKPTNVDLNQELETLRANERELQDTIESQVKMLEDLTQRNLDLEQEIERNEKGYKEKYNHLQLEILDKLEISANEHRENMKAYNREWEDRRDGYESTIKDLERQIEFLKDESDKAKLHLNANLTTLSQDFQRVKTQHDSLLQEKQSLADENEKLCKKLSGLEEKRNDNESLQTRIEKLLVEKEQLITESSKIQQKLQAAEAQIEDYCNEDEVREELIKSLQGKMSSVETLQEEKQKLNENLEEIQHQMSEMNERHVRLQEEMQSKISAVKTLQEEKQKLNENLEEIQRQMSEMNERHIKLLEEMQSKISSVETLQEEKQKLSENLEEVQSQMSEMNERHIKQIEEMQSKISSVETLQEEKQMLNENLEKVQREMSELNERHTKLLEEIQNLETRVADSNRNCETMEVQLKEIDTINKENLRTLNMVNSEKKELEVQLIGKTKEFEEHLMHIEGIKEQRCEIEEQLKEKVKAIEDLQKKTAILEEHLQQEKLENEKHTSESADLSQKISSMHAQLQQSLKTLDDFKERETNSSKENESLRDTIATLTTSSSSLKLEKCNLDVQLQECNEELQQMRNKHNALENQLKQLTEENKSLSEQCCQLKEQNVSLQKQLKCVEEKGNMEDMLEQMRNENVEISHNLRLVNDKLESKQNELDKLIAENSKSKKDIELLKCSLTKSSRENNQLENQLEQCAKLSEEKSKLESYITDLKSSQAIAVRALQDEKCVLKETLTKYEQQLSLYKEKEETLVHKIDSLSQQLHEMHSKADTFGRLLVEHEEVEKSLSVAKEQNDVLSNEIIILKTSITSDNQAHEDIIQSQNKQLLNLNLQLQQSKQVEQELVMKLHNSQETLKSNQLSLERQSQEHKDSLAELQLKYESLQTTYFQLQTHNQHLEQQIQRAHEQFEGAKLLQDEYGALKVQYDNLQRKMEDTVEEAGRCSRALREDLSHHKLLLEKQLESYNVLREDLNNKELSFEAEKQQLNTAITNLRETNSALEEKIREITIGNLNQELQHETADSINTSAEANTSSTTPRSRRSNESKNQSFEGKRKSHRQSLYNERRTSFGCVTPDEDSKTNSVDTCCNCVKLSRKLQDCEKLLIVRESQVNALTMELEKRPLNGENAPLDKVLKQVHNKKSRESWIVTHDRGTMTDPVDASCNCIQLDQKLRDCEMKLFIRNSQVTAMNMELKNHPLKEENALLIKRLQEEQDNCRSEIKRYKQKLYDQTIKTERALAAAMANAESNAAQVPASTSQPPIVMLNAETQTDCDISASLNKLQGKYNDMINICRYRKNMINQLEERLAQKENTDGNAMPTPEAGEMVMLKSKYESIKKELKIVQEKYEYAKQILASRREEISRLRSLEQSKK